MRWVKLLLNIKNSLNEIVFESVCHLQPDSVARWRRIKEAKDFRHASWSSTESLTERARACGRLPNDNPKALMAGNQPTV
jgi:hypothetical protein